MKKMYLIVGIKLVHHAKILISNPNNNDTQRQITRWYNLSYGLSHIVDHTISEYQKYSVIELVHLGIRFCECSYFFQEGREFSRARKQSICYSVLV